MKNTLLDAVSHELKNPLSVIMGGAALTLESRAEELSEDARRLLIHRLIQQSGRLSSLLSDLLDFQRIDAGAILEPRRSPTDMEDLFNKVLRNLDANDHIVEVDSIDAVVSVDGPKVERIAENLLANALKHTPPSSHIWVRVRLEDDGVLLTVEDDGAGVPDEFKPYVFDAFRRGEGA